MPTALLASAGEEVPDAIAAYKAGDWETARVLWQGACDAGNPAACHEVAVVYRDGEGVPADAERAKQLFEQACTGGFGDSCFNLGNKAEGETRLSYFERGCALDSVGSCARIGMAYRDGKDTGKDAGKAVDYLTRACLIDKQQAGPACFMLAGLYDIHDEFVIEDDGATANRWLARGCSLTDVQSCQNLGFHYRAGYGIGKDLVKSNALYAMACNDASSLACPMFSPREYFGAAPAYRGSEIKPDKRQAAGLYRTACERGLALGCAQFAYAILRGGKAAKNRATIDRYLKQTLELDPGNWFAEFLIDLIEKDGIEAWDRRNR
ncbi:tetratricopeptide repeat protein [Parerythrobacter aestuarii]|uniref:tetratricopeptide repeat protein n=1 Tax=Parerythrobacter aestuarii TaxID=3020909 RepID=UPI0024DEC906|nr:tetratricopeptide repeat protein [Parerythrobacter aestuarii]